MTKKHSEKREPRVPAGRRGSREANALGTRIFIADIFELRRERLIALFDRTLDVIEDAMKARKFLVVNRVLVDVGSCAPCR